MSETKLWLYVGIVLKGDNLNPEYITKELGVQPTEAHHKGKERITSTNKKFITKTGVWIYNLGLESSVLSKHMSMLAEIFRKSDLSTLDTIDSQESYIDVLLISEVDKSGGMTLEFDIPKDCFDILKQLGLPVHFTSTFVQGKDVAELED